MTRPGDVLFVKGTTLVSALIRWVTKNPYTHVVLALGEGAVIESDRFIGTRIRQLTDADRFDTFRLHDVDDATLELVCTVAISFEGARYDYLQVAGQAFRLLFGWNEPLFNRANRLICSELIDVSFIASYVPRSHQDNIGDVSPGELLGAYDLRKARMATVSSPVQVVQ